MNEREIEAEFARRLVNSFKAHEIIIKGAIKRGADVPANSCAGIYILNESEDETGAIRLFCMYEFKNSDAADKFQETIKPTMDALEKDLSEMEIKTATKREFSHDYLIVRDRNEVKVELTLNRRA